MRHRRTLHPTHGTEFHHEECLVPVADQPCLVRPVGPGQSVTVWTVLPQIGPTIVFESVEA